MSIRIALLDGSDVVNVAAFPDDFTGDTWDGYTALPAPDEVAPGWTHDGARFVPPPLPPVRRLTVDRFTMTKADTAPLT